MAGPNFLIVDDHPLFLEALQHALREGFPEALVESAGTIQSAKDELRKGRTDLILLDLRMPDTSGFDGLIELHRAWPRVPVAVISAMADHEVIRKIQALGAQGFIHKGQHRLEILATVAALLDGEICFPEIPGANGGRSSDNDLLQRLRELTPQQFNVLTEICKGKLNKQIAYDLGVAETTIKAHITSIFKKLGIHSRTQAVLIMQRLKADRPGLEDSFPLKRDGELG